MNSNIIACYKVHFSNFVLWMCSKGCIVHIEFIRVICNWVVLLTWNHKYFFDRLQHSCSITIQRWCTWALLVACAGNKAQLENELENEGEKQKRYGMHKMTHRRTWQHIYLHKSHTNSPTCALRDSTEGITDIAPPTHGNKGMG